MGAHPIPIPLPAHNRTSLIALVVKYHKQILR